MKGADEGRVDRHKRVPLGFYDGLRVSDSFVASYTTTCTMTTATSVEQNTTFNVGLPYLAVLGEDACELGPGGDFRGLADFARGENRPEIDWR